MARLFRRGVAPTSHIKTLIFAGPLLLIFALIYTPDVQWQDQQPEPSSAVRTNLSHIAFAVMCSVETWPRRRGFVESWWRPNQTRGHVYLNRKPKRELLPWPETAPPYRVADNISHLFRDTRPRVEQMPRMVHNILELLREEDENLRWVVIGDDDTVFFVDNLVEVLAEYDHDGYYYLGSHSETVVSNHRYSFDAAFGGGGIVLSRQLAAALVGDMDSCLVRYAQSSSADLIIMACVADIGVNLTPHKGFHQVDLHGDFSGYLSAHPKVPIMSIHHFGAMNPIFPSMDALQSTRHLMTASDADQSRLFQQTVCHIRSANWSVSVSWGYSAQIYERVFPRSYLRTPIETFGPWSRVSGPPFYMFNTRPMLNDPCETPHFFFFHSVSTKRIHDEDVTTTTYLRARPRNLPPCSTAGGRYSADSISKITVFSPSAKRTQIDRCECCDISRRGDEMGLEVKYRECKVEEILA